MPTTYYDVSRHTSNIELPKDVREHLDIHLLKQSEGISYCPFGTLGKQRCRTVSDLDAFQPGDLQDMSLQKLLRDCPK